MKKINTILIMITLLLFIIILFIDSNTLNSLLINYNDIKVKEVAINTGENNPVKYDEKYLAKLKAEATNNNKNTTNMDNNNNNKWTWPTDNNYTITTYYSNSHKAIDIYSHNGYGANIYSAKNGTVSSVKGGCRIGNLSCNGKGGNYVVINHGNNYYSVYMHLKDIRVSTGQSVTAGQIIGTMGNTGNVIPVPTASSPYLGAHLHFCIYKGEPFKGGYPINPMSLY